MTNPRREFLKRGTMAALALSVPASLAKSSFANSSLLAAIGGTPRLSQTNFQPYVNSNFRISSAGSKVADVTLIKVTDLTLPRTQGPGTEVFSLSFDARTSKLIPQNTYRVSHEKLGEFDFLVVPIVSRKKDKPHYEVIVHCL